MVKSIKFHILSDHNSCKCHNMLVRGHNKNPVKKWGGSQIAEIWYSKIYN